MRLLRPLLAFLSVLALLLVSAAAVPVAQSEEAKLVLEPEVDRLVALMERAAPSKNAGTPKDGFAFPGHKETQSERAARYREIARAAWTVAAEPPVKPLLVLFYGKDVRIRTAAAILAVAFHESAFAHDVDRGPKCYRKIEPTRCDSGRAHCMMQIQMTHAGKSPEGYTGAELFADREKCFRSGVRQLAASQAFCGSKGWRERFAVFASGTCERGHKSARELADLVDSWSLRVLASAK